VTSKTGGDKKPYDEVAALERADRDAADFIQHARRAMIDSPETDPVIVVAYDTELFGHWWHEGPRFLARVLDTAADAGIELTTPQRERERAFDQPSIDIDAGSWGSGKDFRVWEAGEAGDLHTRGKAAQYAVAKFLSSRDDSVTVGRDTAGDAILAELLLALSSDWAFMISKDSAADYARGRAHEHFTTVSTMLREDHHRESIGQRHTRLETRLPYVDSRLRPS
jgi:1,4-alpha-glucan branching enzyme